jgi:proteasome accessory factor A
VEIQKRLLELANDFVASGKAEACVPGASQIISCWQETLEWLERKDLAALARRCDWALKYLVLERQRGRRGLGWQSAEVKCLDMRYASLDAQEGLFLQLAAAGQVEGMPTQARIEHFVQEPPEETRAYLRAHVLRRLGDQVMDMDWDRIRFRVQSDHYWSASLSLWMLDPTGFGRTASEGLLDHCDGVRELLDAVGPQTPAPTPALDFDWPREPLTRRRDPYLLPISYGW